ncbi:MAG: hypothetical protein FJ012_06780 [Chloroflexi bacterium]|nr:hypothetical protein [Chloroflexota bacterium]
MLESFEATETIDGLCEKLADTQFEDYDDENDLLAEVGDLVTEYFDSQLGGFASVSVEGKDRGKIKPVWAYGADLYPDIAVEVGGLPTVAIEIRLANREDGIATPVVDAIGRTVIYSLQYSYGIVFVLDRSDSDVRKHWLDSELGTRLWDNHRIRLIVRP